MNFFQRIFHRPQPPQTQPAVMMTAVPYFTPFSGNAYESAVYRAPVEAIARQLAKLKASHVIKLDGGRQPGDAVLNQLLQVRWNPYMSAHDALCKMATLLYLYNNAFAYLQRDDTGNVIAIYPLNTTSMEFLDDGTGTLYCRFYFPNGQNYILPYSDIVHLRRHFHENDLLGDPNTAILPTLQLAQTQDEGITAGIKQGATIRGILKYNQVVAPEILEKERQAFMANYLSIGNTGGLAALDAKYGFTPLESKPYSIDSDQLAAVKGKIYEYLGVSESIVNGSYDESTGVAFYESVVEPFAAQASQEFTAKLFTPMEQQYGNAIIFEPDALDFASYKSRVSMLAAAMPAGLFSVDEAREILHMPPIGGAEGEKRLQTLNMVQSDKANQYQGVEGNEGNS